MPLLYRLRLDEREIQKCQRVERNIINMLRNVSTQREQLYGRQITYTKERRFGALTGYNSTSGTLSDFSLRCTPSLTQR
jgi:hypothetical protein